MIDNNPDVPSQIVDDDIEFPQYINNLGIIPTSYKEAMSYFETLAWFCEYLENTLIPTINQNGQAVEELQSLYVELKSFVESSLEDLSEEIPTKLSDLDNDTGFITNEVNDLLNYYTKSQSDSRYILNENIVTSVSSSSTNTQVPSAKLFYDTIGNLETILETLDTGGGVE